MKLTKLSLGKHQLHAWFLCVCCVYVGGGGGVCACAIWHWQSILWMGQSVSLEPAKGDKDDTALAVQFIKNLFQLQGEAEHFSYKAE